MGFDEDDEQSLCRTTEQSIRREAAAANAFLVIGAATGVMLPQLPSIGSLKILIHASSDLANIHDPALSSRFHRRLSQHQSLSPVLEADFGRGALLDAIDEGADLRIEGLAVALDEEVEIGRGRLGHCGGVAAQFVGLSIAADDHSRRAE